MRSANTLGMCTECNFLLRQFRLAAGHYDQCMTADGTLAEIHALGWRQVFY